MPTKITLEEVLSNLNSKNYELLNINDFKNTNTIRNFKCNIHNIEWKCSIRYVFRDIKTCKDCKENKKEIELYDILMGKGFKMINKIENNYQERYSNNNYARDIFITMETTGILGPPMLVLLFWITINTPWYAR